MAEQFFPLYCALVLGSLAAAGLAVWWGLKLREGDLHLLGPRPAPAPTQTPTLAPADDPLPLVPH